MDESIRIGKLHEYLSYNMIITNRLLLWVNK